MKKLLLITGDLATGKSTFAGQLARRYGVHVFYKDTFKEILGDTIGFSSREENLKLSVASAALMRMVFSEFCGLGEDLILESNFRQAELELLHEIADRHGYEVLTVALRGDLQVLHERFLHRLYHEDRHVVHACGGFEDLENFRAYVLGQRDLQIPGEHLELSADTFDYQEDEGVLARLDRFMGREGHVCALHLDR
ncbi:MAG: AAA family ATPase [Oscillospiraceae bacterium]|nr:AAA family ATPase [Oscillospiraceae bacterium]